MNYAAIGGFEIILYSSEIFLVFICLIFVFVLYLSFRIISHEITHSFDHVMKTLKHQNENYKQKIQCIVDQYSSYRVKEVEDAYGGEQFHLNGAQTEKEDIADIGAVKIAFEAYKAWERENKHQNLPIGLQDYTFDQIFWISHAQTFCEFERPSRTKTRVENENYSPGRFRINGPISNSKYFAESFNCPETAKMVKHDDTKCLLW